MKDQFIEIKKNYLATFPQKSIDIKSAREINDGLQLHLLLHKLAGSSGGYGFDELSHYCQSALKLMEENKEDGMTYLDELLEQIVSLLEMQY